MKKKFALWFISIFYFSSGFLSAQGLEIKNPGTPLTYIARDGKPLLAFGCHLEHMFLRDNDPDYTVWSKWAQAHGLNHCRIRVMQPNLRDQYKPYLSAGKGQYDLKQFDPVFWKRFRDICMNLRNHGIIMHFLVFPHNGHVRGSNWRETLYNPDNNINPETDHLNGPNHYQFWHSVADGETGLWGIQRAALEKMVELTADLDNVYYDLSHEFRTDCCGAESTDWTKARRFFETAAAAIRTKYTELQPDKQPLIGLDAEHFHKVAGQREWNFGNPAFDLTILGNSSESRVPSVDTVMAWRKQYRKPFLLQEGGADDDRGGKIYISYHSTKPAIIRKYVWKWMMAKNQMINIYQKMDEAHGYADNYDPSGYSSFENDARILRDFWNSLTDYGNLDYTGRMVSGPGFRKMVLSSATEAVAYMASEMGQTGIAYDAQEMRLTGLAVASGSCTIKIWKPEAPGGSVKTIKGMVTNGSISMRLPSFTDDLAVHITHD